MERDYYAPPTLSFSDLADASTRLQSPNGGFVDSAIEGALSSFGLGTAIRDFATPDHTSGGLADTLLRSNPITGFYQQAKDLVNDFRPPSPVLSQKDYQSSQYFRPSIPWDPKMTEDRAAALSTFYDASQVRQQKLAQTPGWAPKLLGSLVGQALDPINYIPFLGEAAQAAAVGKMGVIGGRMLAAGADAALNTGVSAALTAPTRAQFGDDVSFQTSMLDVASAAVIGAAFGGLGGVLADRRISRERAALRNVADTHAALNDAVGSILNDGEVRLRPETVEGIARVAAQDAPDFRVELPTAGERSGAAPFADTAPAGEMQIAAAEGVPPQEAVARPAPVQLARLPDSEPLQASAKADGDIALAYSQNGEDLGRVIVRDNGEELRVQNIFTNDKMRADAYNTQGTRLMRALVEQARALFPEAKYITGTRVGGARFGGVHVGEEKLGAEVRIPVPPARQPKTDLTVPKPDAPPDGLARAAQMASKPAASLKEIAEDFRLDPETGAFPELDDYQLLEAQGRLTAAEKADFDATTEILTRSKTYADALQQAAICGMN